MSNKINTIITEDKLYQRWEREQKNRILAIYNPTRKREEWKKMFGTKQEPDDSYLLGDIF